MTSPHWKIKKIPKENLDTTKSYLDTILKNSTVKMSLE